MRTFDCRLACNMGYAGQVFGLNSLGGDIYINNLIGGGVELVSYSIIFSVVLGGRKKVYIALMVVGGAGIVASVIVQEMAPGKLVWLVRPNKFSVLSNVKPCNMFTKVTWRFMSTLSELILITSAHQHTSNFATSMLWNNILKIN